MFDTKAYLLFEFLKKKRYTLARHLFERVVILLFHTMYESKYVLTCMKENIYNLLYKI